MENTAQQKRVIRTLSAAQILNGIGTSGTVAAGSLLIASISKSESLAGLAQTTTVLGAAIKGERDYAWSPPYSSHSRPRWTRRGGSR